MTTLVLGVCSTSAWYIAATLLELWRSRADKAEYAVVVAKAETDAGAVAAASAAAAAALGSGKRAPSGRGAKKKKAH